MKTVIIYNGHTITANSDSHCALVFKGENLTDEQLNGTDLIVSFIAGDIKMVDGKPTHNAIEKAKSKIDSFK